MQHQPKDANDALRMPVPGLIPSLLRKARTAVPHVEAAPQFWPAQQQQQGKDVHRRYSKVESLLAVATEESGKLGISAASSLVAPTTTSLPPTSAATEVQ
jgi:hypothetical protein